MKKRIIIEIEIDDIPSHEESDFIKSLAEDITNGDTAQEYYISFVEWSWSDNHLCNIMKKVDELKYQIDIWEKAAYYWEQEHSQLKHKYEPEVFAVPDTKKFSPIEG